MGDFGLNGAKLIFFCNANSVNQFVINLLIDEGKVGMEDLIQMCRCVVYYHISYGSMISVCGYLQCLSCHWWWCVWPTEVHLLFVHTVKNIYIYCQCINVWKRKKVYMCVCWIGGCQQSRNIHLLEYYEKHNYYIMLPVYINAYLLRIFPNGQMNGNLNWQTKSCFRCGASA